MDDEHVEQPPKNKGGRKPGARVRDFDEPGPRGGGGNKRWYASFKPDAKKAVRLIEKGVPACHSLLLAGYAKTVAKRGISALPQKYRDVLQKRTRQRIENLTKLSQETTDTQLRDVVRGALVQNIGDRQDAATASIKMAGQLKGVNMFTPENVTGIVVIQAPKGGLPPLPHAIEQDFPPLPEPPK